MNKLILPEEKQPVPQLKLLPGGKDTGVWLSNLASGTVFLATNKTQNTPFEYLVQEWDVVAHYKRHTKLSTINPQTGQPIYMTVNTVGFSNAYRLDEVILDGADIEDSRDQ